MTFNKGYIEVPMRGHHLAKANGFVSVHRLVAEAILGRDLTKTEVVHHCDDDRSNNDPKNIWVFASQSDHARYHQTGVAVQQADGTYVSPVVAPATHPCAVCGNQCTGKTCSYKCSALKQRKVERPARAKLLRLTEGRSVEAVGRMLGVSGNTIRKWLKDAPGASKLG